MRRLYFMQRVFEAKCFRLDDPIEYGEIELLFPDSWYWLHYEFFNARDMIASEESASIQTHLYNLCAMLYRTYEKLPETLRMEQHAVDLLISEIVDIAEYSENFTYCLWTYGDEASLESLQVRLEDLPSQEQLASYLTLPHSTRTQRERTPYRYISPIGALKRLRKEEAAKNKRLKLASKNRQRESSS